MNCDRFGSILRFCFQCKDRLEKRVSTERDGAVVSPRSFPTGRGGRGETCIDAIILSAARIFRRLRDFPLLADLDLFSARNFRSAVRVNPPSLDATSAPLVHLFPRNFVERATPSPPPPSPRSPPRCTIYLSTDLPRLVRRTGSRKPVMHAG